MAKRRQKFDGRDLARDLFDRVDKEMACAIIEAIHDASGCGQVPNIPTMAVALSQVLASTIVTAGVHGPKMRAAILSMIDDFAMRIAIAKEEDNG